MLSVAKERWRLAQRGEATYWRATRTAIAEQSRILNEKIVALDLAMQAVPELRRCEGLKVEIGIGPMGIGVLHFLNTDGPIVGLDPLPAIRTAGDLPWPLTALVQACWQEYVHLQARGEELPIASDCASVVACYNVLDHVQAPPVVLAEIYRILRPKCYLLLGCDTVSLASLLKFHAYARWRDSESLAAVCHPFRFRAVHLEQMVRQAGFYILWVRRRLRERFERVAGHAFRSLIVAQKPAFLPANGHKHNHAV